MWNQIIVDDYVFYLFWQKQKPAQRYIPTVYLSLVLNKAYMMMLFKSIVRCAMGSSVTEADLSSCSLF
jgi:hypothetical protein